MPERKTRPSRRTGAGARINADNIWVYRAIVLCVVSSGISGMLMSWSGQLFIAKWFILPAVLSWTVPVALDVPIATLSMASLAMKSRGRIKAAFWFTVIAIVFTSMSAVGNFLYVESHTHLANYQAWTGALGKGAAPFITLVMFDVLGALVTRPQRVSKKSKRRASAKPRTAPVRDVPSTAQQLEGIEA